MKLKLENIFLFDGLGATLSFLGTGWIFPTFSKTFGIPQETFYLLALFPLIYCIYSFTCHFLVTQKKTWMLRLIIWANLFYCTFSLSFLLTANELTSMGYALLMGEILIILGVVYIEYKVYKRLTDKKNIFISRTAP